MLPWCILAPAPQSPSNVQSQVPALYTPSCPVGQESQECTQVSRPSLVILPKQEIKKECNRNEQRIDYVVKQN